MGIAKEAHRGRLNAWCMAALLDVKNAFNSANWEKIVEGMVKKGVSVYLRNLIREYLSERKIFLDRDTGKEIYIGVPQGSVLGLLLWNILYDGVFEVDLPECSIGRVRGRLGCGGHAQKYRRTTRYYGGGRE